MYRFLKICKIWFIGILIGKGEKDVGKSGSGNSMSTKAPGLLDAHHRLGDIKTVVSYFFEIRQQVDEHQARIDTAFTGAQP